MLKIPAASLLSASLFGVCLLASAPAPSWADASQAPDVERRIDTILKQMTAEEKVDLLGGVNLFDVRGVPRLGVPVMAAADGPFGVRRYARSNVMAGGIALAATWNTSLAHEAGTQMGRDSRSRGVHFYLAPGVNIYRSPLNGRNFEYLGEDPFLAGSIAVDFITGVQSQGVCATVKHFLGNNSEYARHRTDTVVDERTAREIYMPAFEAAVKQGKVAAVMTSYNLVNGEHMSASRHFNIDVLKREWGFPGLIMSDWDSTYDVEAAANGGLDLEMPSGKFLNRTQLLPLIKQGKVTQATIDDKVRRILRTAATLGWLDREQLDASIPRYNPQGRAAALQEAREGMVLLKNSNGVLPLSKDKVKTIAVIGPDAYPAVPHGGGSVTVAPFRATGFFEGIAAYAGTAVNVHYLRGLPDLRKVANATNFSTAASGGKPGVTVDVFDNIELSGTPTTHIDRHINQGAPLDLTPFAIGEFELDLAAMATSRNLSTRWTGFYTPSAAGNHDVFVQVGGFSRVFGYRLFVDDKLVIDNWEFKRAAVDQVRLSFTATAHKIVLEHRTQTGGLDGPLPFVRLGVMREGGWTDPAALQLAAKADAVVIAAGFDATSETEDWDRSFGLPPGQDELIQKIAAANKNTIVVMTSGGAVDTTKWLDGTAALLQAWYPGQEGGTALAEILFGDVNPSGHLPATFEQRWEDNPVHDSYYPEPGTNRVTYKEGVFVGYRGYEHTGTKPLFAFGYGLSYTSFKYGDLAVKRAAAGSDSLYEVSFNVTNTGGRAGATVPQLYVADVEASVPRPPKELKGFAKVSLQPGETRKVTLPLNARAFAFYDVKAGQWRAEAGAFQLLVGESSDQPALKVDVSLDKTILIKN